MRINYKYATRTPRKFQQGGPVEAPMEGAPEEAPAGAEEQAPAGAEEQAPAEGGGDPMMQIAQIFAQGLQNQDCQALAQGAQMFLQMLQQSQGGGQPEQQAEPVFRKGGKLSYRIY